MNCRHSPYADGHCAEMACDNYFSRCPRHAYSGSPDATCVNDDPPPCPWCGHPEHRADVCEHDLGEYGECHCVDDRKVGS